MSPLSRGRLAPLTALCVAAATGLAACGGDDDKASSEPADAKTDTSAKSPSLDTVLSCLKTEGLDAKDQSSSTGDTIGIDHPGGRTVISFEKTEEDAKTLEGVATTQAGPGGETFRQGKVVVSIPDDPAASVDKPAIETCLAG